MVAGKRLAGGTTQKRDFRGLLTLSFPTQCITNPTRRLPVHQPTHYKAERHAVEEHSPSGYVKLSVRPRARQNTGRLTRALGVGFYPFPQQHDAKKVGFYPSPDAAHQTFQFPHRALPAGHQ
jgi:hypothetical protein